MKKEDANKFAEDLDKVFKKHNIKMWRASRPKSAITCPSGQEPVRIPTSTGKWIWVCQDA